MENQEISRQLQRLRSLIKRTNEACTDNLEIQADWAKYICVIGSGLIENGIRHIYMEYASKTVSKPIAKYVNSHLSAIRNPKSDRFLEVAGAFKEEWKEELEVFLNEDGRGDAIDSLMDQRHLIAHGKAHNSSLTMGGVLGYLEKAIQVLKFIESQCKR